MKNNFLYKLTLALISLSIIFSCSKESEIAEVKGQIQEGFPVQIALENAILEPMTYAVDDYVPAEVYEKKLKSAVAVIFNAEDDKFIDCVDVELQSVIPSSEEGVDDEIKSLFYVPKDKVVDGQLINFYIVGNYTKSEMDRAIRDVTSSQPENLTIDLMKKINVTKYCDEKNSFVMVGEKNGQVKLKRNHTQVTTDPIYLQRLSARIDVKIVDAPCNDAICIYRVTLHNRQKHSYLFTKGGGTENLDTSIENKTYGNSNFKAFEGAIYTYENSNTIQDKDDIESPANKNCYLEVVLKMNNYELKPIFIPFEDMAIERNHIYYVYLSTDPDETIDPDNPTVNPPRITFMVDSEDWELENRFEEDYSQAEIPAIKSLVAYDATWAAELQPSEVKHVDDAPDYNKIEVNTNEEYHLVMTTESDKYKGDVRVLASCPWIKVEDVTTYSLFTQTYHITIDKNQNLETREGKIQIFNTADEELNKVITISQIGDELTPYSISKVTAYDSKWSEELTDVEHTDEADHSEIKVNTPYRYNLLVEVEGKPEDLRFNVTEGQEAIRIVKGEVVDNKTEFKLSLKNNRNHIGENRNIEIEFFNKKASSEKISMNIEQKGELRPIMDYFPKFNMRSDMDFCESNSNNESYYFTFEDIFNTFGSTATGMSKKTIEINGKYYHLPSDEELRALVGGKYSLSSSQVSQSSEYIVIGQNSGTKVFNSYHQGVDGVVYALRYIGNTSVSDVHQTDSRYFSAWRYSLIDNPDSEGKALKIETVHLGADKEGEIEFDDIKNEQWWTDHSSEIDYRIIPAAGYRINGSGYTGEKEVGEFIYLATSNGQDMFRVNSVVMEIINGFPEHGAALPLRLVENE